MLTKIGSRVAVRAMLSISHEGCAAAGHPNIVQLKEAYEDHVYVHLIMELCTGGDLVDRIMAKGRYTERDAAAVIRTMLKVQGGGGLWWHTY